ncbi:MAG: hypothetical protein ACK5XQ_13705, partial [Flavobacteriales bacterium]
MYELEQSDKLTPDKIAFEVTMIAACLMPFGKGLKWLGGELYVAVTGGVETAAVGLGVYYFTHDFIVQYRALEMLPKDQRNKAMLELLAMSLMMGFLTYKAVRGVSESLGYKEPYKPKPGDQNRPSDALVDPSTKKLVTEQPESTNTNAKPGEVKPAVPEVAQENSLPPFTDKQIEYNVSGNIEYMNVKLETGELVTLKRENGGDWFVSKRGAGKTTDAEILSRVPGGYKKVNISSNENEITVGNKIGEGGNKDVYEIINQPDRVIGVLRRSNNELELLKEIEILSILQQNGLPVVETFGTIRYQGKPAIVYKKYAQGS